MILVRIISTGIQVFFCLKITAFKGLGKACPENSFESLIEKFKNMKKLLFISMVVLATTNAQAKIWRVNNNAGIVADFSSLTAAVSSASVLSGDTIHVEPSATTYTGPTISKQLVIIGNGYFLTGAGGNNGLQATITESSIGDFRFASGSAGTKLIGLVLQNNSFAAGYNGNVNITFEKCRFTGIAPLNFENRAETFSNITIRKCFFSTTASTWQAGTATLNNFTIENSIFASSISLPNGAGTLNFVFRNNHITGVASLSNAYVANSVFASASQNTFTSCNVKNNLFVVNQTGVTTGPLSTNGNNLVSQTLTSIIVNTGSDDGKFQLAAGSPAIGGGVDISGTKPDCGAFGGTDPYKLSGIPGIPTIYALTVPASIPLATPTMNVTISTRNNN